MLNINIKPFNDAYLVLVHFSRLVTVAPVDPLYIISSLIPSNMAVKSIGILPASH